MPTSAEEACDEVDHKLGAFLDFIARDIATHPERLVPFPQSLAEEMRRVAAGLAVNLDEPIEGPVAL